MKTCHVHKKRYEYLVKTCHVRANRVVLMGNGVGADGRGLGADGGGYGCMVEVEHRRASSEVHYDPEDATLYSLFIRPDTILLLLFMATYNLKSSFYIMSFSDEVRGHPHPHPRTLSPRTLTLVPSTLNPSSPHPSPRQASRAVQRPAESDDRGVGGEDC